MSRYHTNILLPLLVFLVFSGIALLLYKAQLRHENELFLYHTRTIAEQVRTRFEGLMDSRIATLQVFGDRWMEKQPQDFSPERFFSFSEILLRRYPGFRSIRWINSEGQIEYTFSDDPADPGAGIYAQASQVTGAALREARENLTYSVTPWTRTGAEKDWMEVFHPLIFMDKIHGYFTGVFQIDRLMDIVVPKEVLNDFQVNLHEDGRKIYQSGAAGDLMVDSRTYSDIHVGPRTWLLELIPASAKTVSSSRYLVLLFGLTISALLSTMLYLLIRRMDLYKASRDTALREVGERIRIEKALLENEKKLKTLLAELKESNAELESFVYIVSHDLKTPIVTIDGFIGALREDFSQSLGEDAKKYLDYMSDASHKMDSLIQDLLELSRIGRATEKKSVFPVMDVVEEVVELLKPRIEANGIKISVQDVFPEINADRNRVVQVFDNLFSNAVKYLGSENNCPEIHIGCQSQNGEDVFFVQDNGIGIEERYFEKIFQIFQRLPAATKICEGTGMGLTIAKKIIDHHGGSIWLSSQPGIGTTFYFTLSGREHKS